MNEAPKPCERYRAEAAKGILDEAMAREWREHSRTCTACRRAWISYEQPADILRRTPVPRLSPNFEARLRRRLRQRDGSRALPPGARLAMRLYWAAASLAGFYVAFHAPWPAMQHHPAAWIGIGMIGLGAATACLLPLKMRTSVFDLAIRILG